ncbi:MAG: tetratricopeptide repeat protein [Elusimicrobia bacterium]|nr:tetratricopeptide repeat protein [Elusimicrobiota bacterium]
MREFAKAVVSNPSEPMGHLMLGSAYYWAGNVPQAEAEFRAGLKLDPDNAQGHLLMGILHAWKGDTDSAYAEFQTGARLDPKRPDLQMDLGSVEETLGRFPDALEHFRRAVALDASHPLYHYQLGMLYRRLGRDTDAADSLGAALKRYPDFEDAALELGAAYERMGKDPEALDEFNKAVRLKARDAVARYRLGRAYLIKGDAKKARAVFADAFHLTPEDNQGGLALSVSFGGEAEGAGGEGAPKQPEKPKPSQAPQPQAAPQPAAQGNPSDPLDVIARNLERLPLDQEAVLEVDMAFIPRPKLERKNASEAGSSLKSALEKAGRLPPRPTATGVRREFKLRATTDAQRAAQVKQVMDELREVLRQAPPDAEVRMGMNLSYAPKSRLAGRSGEASGPGGGPGSGAGGGAGGTSDSKARVSYQPRDVGNDMGLWVMGTSWMALVEETLPEPGEAPSHPDTSDWWVASGLGFASLGQSRAALASFDRAVAADASNEQAWMGRAVALVEAGREPEAEQALVKVLTISPKNRAAKDGLKWLRQPRVSASANPRVGAAKAPEKAKTP